MLRAPSHLAVGPGCLACRAAWRAGLPGVPAGGDPPTVLLAAPLAFRALSRLTVGPGCLACRRAAAPAVLLAAPLAFRALSRLTVGPGCLACRRAAARPLAVRAASFARRVVSKPGQAPPPPTGTTTRPLRHRSQAPHDFWYCYVAPRVFQTPPTPSTPAALGMLTYGLAHHPEARVGTASTHRHGSRTPLPRCRLFLSGVTPFSWALHHFPGGVMLPNWCNAP